jgi:hypothetical protein
VPEVSKPGTRIFRRLKLTQKLTHRLAETPPRLKVLMDITMFQEFIAGTTRLGLATSAVTVHHLLVTA